jgi:protein-S-isoprenylcysteine O-methyltransferase Ste14
MILPWNAVLLVCYFILFAIVHSLLADSRTKSIVRRFSPGAGRWYRLAFVLLAVVMVLPFLYLLLQADEILYAVPWPWRWLMIAIQLAGAIGLLEATRQTGVYGFLGLDQLSSKDTADLVTEGFYCHVRNPQFLFAMIFLWLFPTMTASLLTFNLLATLYFYLGARHEEITLQEQFKEKYRSYREAVPMFLPKLRCG